MGVLGDTKRFTGIDFPNNVIAQMNDQTEDSNTTRFEWVFTIVVAIAILAIVYCAGTLTRVLMVNSHAKMEPNEFGDMYGWVDALFSGFAFLGVVVAILLQRQELRLQRAEVRQTRKELAGQREQLEQQNATFRQQMFDSAFFQMLSLHHEIVNGIDLERRNPRSRQLGNMIVEKTNAPATPITGRDCFGKFCDRLWTKLEQESSLATGKTVAGLAYDSLHKEIQADVGHYFRHLYNIVKFIDRSNIESKRVYSNLLRAQLSSNELVLLFYNCVSKHGAEKFKPLVERYSLLKNLPKDALFDESHAALFEASAFGDLA